jgi:hypothetical protein
VEESFKTFWYTAIDMDSSIWFYTFSTSAQVMAALVGLFAVFIVYKIQEFSSNLSQARDATVMILTYVGANTKGYTALKIDETVSMSDDEIILKFRELLDIKNSEPDRMSASQTVHLGVINYEINEISYTFYNGLVQKKNLILNELKKILILSFTVITISVLAIIGTDYLICNWLLFVFGILFVYVLYAIVSGVYKVATQ